jgi:hypothetical protein
MSIAGENFSRITPTSTASRLVEEKAQLARAETGVFGLMWGHNRLSTPHTKDFRPDTVRTPGLLFDKRRDNLRRTGRDGAKEKKRKCGMYAIG